MNTELKPCPFCGENKNIDYGICTGTIKGFDYVQCENCGAEIHAIHKGNYIAAEELWNRRTSEPIPEPEPLNLEQLKQRCGESYIEGCAENCPFYNVPPERIVVLPCKVGDKAFYIYSETDGKKVIGGPDEITEVGSKGYWVSSIVNEKNMDIFTPYTELGKTEFLTREEAEKALERMKEDD